MQLQVASHLEHGLEDVGVGLLVNDVDNFVQLLQLGE